MKFVKDLIILVAVCVLLNEKCYCKDSYTQLSDQIIPNINCVPYAYGDYNADKLIDIFCISGLGIVNFRTKFIIL